MVVKGRLHYGGEQLLNANMDIDVFAKKTQKITLVAKMKRLEIEKGYNFTSEIEMHSRGQQLNVILKSHVEVSKRSSGFGSVLSYTDQHQKPKSVAVLYHADPAQMYFIVTGPNRDLLRITTNMQLQKNLQKIDSYWAIADMKPYVVNFEHDWNSFKYSEYQEGTLQRSLDSHRIEKHYSARFRLAVPFAHCTM